MSVKEVLKNSSARFIDVSPVLPDGIRVVTHEMAGDRDVRIGRDAVGNVRPTADDSAVANFDYVFAGRVEAMPSLHRIAHEAAHVVQQRSGHVAGAKRGAQFADPAAVDIATELAAIRMLLMGLESQHANKIGRALDDADEEAGRKTGANKEELGKALERALTYARSATGFATATEKLGPHLENVVAWLGAEWTVLLMHLA